MFLISRNLINNCCCRHLNFLWKLKCRVCDLNHIYSDQSKKLPSSQWDVSDREEFLIICFVSLENSDDDDDYDVNSHSHNDTEIIQIFSVIPNDSKQILMVHFQGFPMILDDSQSPVRTIENPSEKPRAEACTMKRERTLALNIITCYDLRIIITCFTFL